MALSPSTSQAPTQSRGEGVNYWAPGNEAIFNDAVAASGGDFNPRYDNESESSLVASIYSTARIYSESIEHGTPNIRTSIFKHSYTEPSGSEYKWRIPATVQAAVKLQRYMGAGDGKWVSGDAPDQSPNNQLDAVGDINVTFTPDFIEDQDWDNGAISVKYRDRNSLYFPALQTIYPDDTSVLNSLINSKACATMEVISDGVWRDLVGNASLTPDQFLERSDTLIAERAKNLFDNRVIISPRTFYTDADKQRGYSWSCAIRVFMPNMKLVGSFTIESDRIEEFGQ